MSVIIKGMDMPKSCIYCQFRDGWFCTVPDHRELDRKNISRGREKWCSLGEVPTPHGNLIDVDEADKYAYAELELANGYRTGWEAARAMQKIYQSVSPVIEAEE